ncbi:hypothetical protein [Mobilicoccus pelagius]|uniref:Methionine aminopeptidase n=1 Tax=Mobilicoccus pelagius NBRC 104925 TaxID=1089455 RepID=H5UQ34_9MICO|nr:hypothetical protein [Mobilicoccus pelagius]GAB47839.1 hypothetical protein MOPEL_029_01200 [Mobilicoccus pelagius NBRC 104925]
MSFWFNIKTHQVEDDEHTSPKENLLGPYPTREAAQNALQSTADRTAAWEEEERLEREAKEKEKEF